MGRIAWSLLSRKKKRKFEQLLEQLEASMKGLYDPQWIDELIANRRELVRHLVGTMKLEGIFALLEHSIDENNWIRSPKKHGNLLECACCGYLTLRRRPSLIEHGDACPVCAWEDEFDCDPYKRSGCNRGLTLMEAGENFWRLGVCDPELKRIVILDPDKYFRRARAESR